jgi:UDP-N-acetylmuramoyl-tripeptide--D-alanyl-D-alanine ligase
LAGAYNVKNALAAIAIAQEADIASASIRQGLESVKPLFGRSEILTGAVTVIQDCYNANPESTAEALAFCDCLEWSGKRIYVIGSMFELGERSNAAHEELGRRLAASRADFIYLLGAETRTAADILSTQQKIPFFYTESMQELSKSIAGSVQNGDLVLLKGSRRCALERLTAVLKEALK